MSGAASTGLLDRLGVRLPIIQAPMAGISSPAMAAAVGAAGGLGSLGLGAADADTAARLIRETRERYEGPLNVNLFCHAPPVADDALAATWIERFRSEFKRLGMPAPRALSAPYRSFIDDRDMLAMLLELRPSAASFHFGLPSADVVAALRDAGLVLFATATTVEESNTVEAAGCDAVIAQGWEAGGHRGVFDPTRPDDGLGTVALTRLLVSARSLPVVAAGGIMDGAGIASMLALGAEAAQLGTAFVACDESLADEGYRRALFSEAARHTVMIRSMSGRPARGLQNRFTALAAAVPAEAIPAYPIAYDLGKRLNEAAQARGEFGFGAHWAGEGAPLARALPAARLMDMLERELREAISASGQLPRRAVIGGSDREED